ncbi:FAD linked oxidase domain-containing protein (plasmid) [Rhizobium gallicum]|uniref:FAD linked oxidase domain-containing protein n=1 Tax=Rhizobium gallicum TaxID=56730 RepID=A0A1L5NS97_9HYPH|nr:FAD-binding oxidoreductase [Rhizobium gallicum]APO70748.1 FAD linked oxidase domain-containing protein [Rhizobium gallicum]
MTLIDTDDHLSSAVADIANAIGGNKLRTGTAIADLNPGEDPDNLGTFAVVSPTSTADVAAIVRICGRYKIPIVAHGGRTGLAGGGISNRHELVVSLQNMRQIEEINPIEGVAVVQAGATLQSLQAAALGHGLEPGIDLASRGSATIGGMISTNAGGMMAFRNGVMRHRVLGVEAVLPDGRVYSDMTRVIKNAAGYDLKHLFIGAEGTLGIVTRAVLRLEPVPTGTASAIFGLPTIDAALELVRLARATGSLRAAEVMWSRYFRYASGHYGWNPSGYNGVSPLHLIVSLTGANEAGVQGAMIGLYETALQTHGETTAVLASSVGQEAEIWRLREDTGLIYRQYPGAPSYDISVPLGHIDPYLRRAMSAIARIDDGPDPFIFGHLADGNLHIVLDRPGVWLTEERREAVESILYQGLGSVGGSFSAEHGVGSKRRESVGLYCSSDAGGSGGTMRG